MENLCVLLAEPAVFDSGCRISAFLGQVPMHTGSGGKMVNTFIPNPNC